MDVFPRSNLPDAAVFWGREVERRIVEMETTVLGIEQNVLAQNRATAASLGALGRQIQGLADMSNAAQDGSNGRITGTSVGAPGSFQWEFSPPLPMISDFRVASGFIRVSIECSSSEGVFFVGPYVENKDVPVESETRFPVMKFYPTGVPTSTVWNAWALNVIPNQGGFQKTWYLPVPSDTSLDVGISAQINASLGYLEVCNLYVQEVPAP